MEGEEKEKDVRDKTVLVENTVQSGYCDLTVIQPGVIREAETELSALAMSKILLERLLVRRS